MEELIKALPSLLGVFVGGLITFFVQNTTVRKQQKWDREKIEWDRQYQEQTYKYQTFNKILQQNGLCKILDYDIHFGSYLDERNYIKHVRPLLFEIFHLLDAEIIRHINIIEKIFERKIAIGDDFYLDEKNDLRDSYQEIIKLIEKHFKELRESKHIK